MAELYSFDVVSKVDLQEVKNAVEQTVREIHTRFDLKETKSDIRLEDDTSVILIAEDDYRLKAVVDIFQTKLVKRKVSLKALLFERIEKALGGQVRQVIRIQQGIPPEKAKEIVRTIREAAFKVQPQIQGDQIRVSGKGKDHLQAAIQLIQSKDFGIDLLFTNYR